MSGIGDLSRCTRPADGGYSSPVSPPLEVNVGGELSLRLWCWNSRGSPGNPSAAESNTRITGIYERLSRCHRAAHEAFDRDHSADTTGSPFRDASPALILESGC